MAGQPERASLMRAVDTEAQQLPAAITSDPPRDNDLPSK
jgi:hypothetical protein